MKRIILLIATIILSVSPAFAAQTTPTPSDEPDALDQAVAARLASHAAQDAVFSYRAVGRTIDLNVGGVIYLEHIDNETGEAAPGLIDLALAVLQNGAWQVYLPGDPNYNSIYALIPNDLVIDARPYKPAADVTRMNRASIRDYRLPWAEGQFATVTRSFNRHGLGQLDFDLSSNEVAAMKDGVVVYANTRHVTNGYASGAWWYWNTIVIQHGRYEYALYGHLAQDSLPDWIAEDCTDDVSVQNCNAYISDGNIIGLEGNTGYSSNPHLHVEFGQAWGIVAYRDTADQDGDGDRLEAVYAPYVYMEQNVSFRGYESPDVAAWTYGTVLQAYHGAAAPEGQNIVQNGDFSAELTGWSASGQISWAARDGMIRFLRLNTAEPPNWASFYQNLGYGADANTPFEVQIALGNDSPYEKTATVMLRNAAGIQYGEMSCDFTLPPHSAPTHRIMRGVTNATWASVRLEVFINPPDSASAALADDISVMRRPDLALSGVECL